MFDQLPATPKELTQAQADARYVQLLIDVSVTPAANKIPRADSTGFLNDWINQGGGSLFDADLLDGLEASDFALAGHIHDDRYYTETEIDGFLDGLLTNIGENYQPLDADLTAIAALSPADGTFIRRTGGAWDAAALVAGDIPDLSAIYQPLDATLTALAAYNTNGLLIQTAPDTFVGRTITGTTNRISVTNGNGVNGNPTLDIGSDVVTLTGSQTLTNKTFTTPTIASFANALHSHQDAAGGGQLNAGSVFNAGLVPLARGGVNADLSATGGANQFLKQSSSGAAITVAGILSADLTSALTTPPAIGGTTPANGTFLAVVGTTITGSGDARFGAAGATAARLNVNPAASQIGEIIRANATTPGNLTEWQNSGGTILALINATGSAQFAAMDNTPIGNTTPAAFTGTTGRFNNDLTLAGAPGKVKPATNSTTALQIAQADGTAFVTFDTTNRRMGVRVTPTRSIGVGTGVANQLVNIDDTGIYFTRTVDGTENASIARDAGSTSNAVFLAYSVSAGAHRFYRGGVLVAEINSAVNAAVDASGVLSVDEIAALTTLNTPSNAGLFINNDQSSSTVDGQVFNRTNRATQVSDRYITTWKWNNSEVAHLANNGELVIRGTDASTNTVFPALTINHKNSSPNAATNFGIGLLFTGDSSTTADQSMAAWEASWSVATHASRVSQLIGYVWNIGTKTAVLTLTPTTVRISASGGLNLPAGTDTAPPGGTSSIGTDGSNNLVFRSNSAIYFLPLNATTQVRVQTDTLLLNNGASANGIYGNNATLLTTTMSNLSAGGAFKLAVKAGGTQNTNNLQEWQDNSVGILALVTYRGGAVFNEQGLDTDFRIEGDTDANLFFLDASADRIGIGNNAPNNKLDVTGTIQADGLQLDDGNIILGTTTGTKIGTATSQKIGLWNATPIVQPSSTGENTGFTAGAGSAVDHQATFTGNVGTKAYTLNDIVKHLKNMGALAA